MPPENNAPENTDHTAEDNIDSLFDKNAADRGDFIGDEALDQDALIALASESEPAAEKPANDPKPSEESATDQAAAEAGKPDEKPVPYSRLAAEVAQKNEARRENERLRAELEALKNGKPAAATEQGTQNEAAAKPADGEKSTTEAVDIRALRRQAKEAFLQGDLDLSDEIEAKIDAEIRRQAAEEADRRYEARQVDEQRAKEAKAFDDVVKDIVTSYPQLDSTSESANKIAIKAVVGLRDDYLAEGMNLVDAIQKASQEVAEQLGFEKSSGKAASVNKGAAVVDPRTQAAVVRGAKASEKSGTLSDVNEGHGNRGTGAVLDKDVTKMTEKEFSSLSEEERARLRGDIV